jgi:hypothetical protein
VGSLVWVIFYYYKKLFWAIYRNKCSQSSRCTGDGGNFKRVSENGESSLNLLFVHTLCYLCDVSMQRNTNPYYLRSTQPCIIVAFFYSAPRSKSGNGKGGAVLRFPVFWSFCHFLGLSSSSSGAPYKTFHYRNLVISVWTVWVHHLQSEALSVLCLLIPSKCTSVQFASFPDFKLILLIYR